MTPGAAKSIVEVAVPLPIAATFHYRVPQPLKRKVAIGQRLWVSFGSRRLLGIIVGFPKRTEVPHLKIIDEILDQEPVLDQELLELTRWVASTYQTGWGEALQTALPSPLRRGLHTMKSREEEAVLSLPPTEPLKLNSEQEQALKTIARAIADRRHQVFLLHGITGSGKTEVYLQAIHLVLAQGRTSIVLVPEISLTPQAIERFQGRFGVERVALLHSGLLESQRLQQWWRIQRGVARIVVGARSAVFAPVRELGLVVVDEEHEPSYKQEDAPRYHAREVAIHRAQQGQAPVILGSATPAMETTYQAMKRRFRLLPLRQRIEEVPLPKVEVIDLREQFSLRGRTKIFSRALEEALAETLHQRQQAILFLNRRGFSTFIQCRSCGEVLRCKSCRVPFTYHMVRRLLVCHYCEATLAAPEVCPHCRSQYVRFQGTGTERVESELARLFPEANIARMDTDSTRARGSHAKILKDFEEQKIDLLVGTQMVAKGLDFPQVTLVGVISADTALNLPDFRSAERTFNLLTQVAGRAGRGTLPGRVMVQTYTPHHYAIQAARTHDYDAFYRQEIAIRRQLRLPPFTRLVQLTVRSRKEKKVHSYALKVAELFRRHLPPEVEVLGPAPATLYRLRRHYRWQVHLKGPSEKPWNEELSAALRACSTPKGCLLTIDVDPR